jgi:hypothetical protein
MFPVTLPYNTCAVAVAGRNPIATARAAATTDSRNRREHARPNTLRSLTTVLLLWDEKKLYRRETMVDSRNEVPYSQAVVNECVRPV